jgi:hypothetical protein
MGIPLVINKKIVPNEKVRFIIRIALGETVIRSNVFEFTAPAAIDSMKLIDTFVANIKKEAGSSQTRNKSWRFDRFRLVPIKDGNKNIPGIKLRLVQAENYSGLKVGEPLKFGSNLSSPLSSLNNRKKQVRARQKNSNDRLFITTRIDATEWNSIGSAGKWNATNPVESEWQTLSNPTPNTISVETKTKQKNNIIDLSISKDISQNLINQESVRDIMIFSYSQFTPSASVSNIDKYFLEQKADKTVKKNNSVKIQRDNKGRPVAPTYEDARKLFLEKNVQKFAYKSLKFDPEEGTRVIFYATVVRYVRRKNGSWMRMSQEDITGDVEDSNLPSGWLQLNESGRPIWARAVGVK